MIRVHDKYLSSVIKATLFGECLNEPSLHIVPDTGPAESSIRNQYGRMEELESLMKLVCGSNTRRMRSITGWLKAKARPSK